MEVIRISKSVEKVVNKEFHRVVQHIETNMILVPHQSIKGSPETCSSAVYVSGPFIFRITYWNGEAREIETSIKLAYTDEEIHPFFSDMLPDEYFDD